MAARLELGVSGAATPPRQRDRSVQAPIVIAAGDGTEIGELRIEKMKTAPPVAENVASGGCGEWRAGKKPALEVLVCYLKR